MELLNVNDYMFDESLTHKEIAMLIDLAIVIGEYKNI